MFLAQEEEAVRQPNLGLHSINTEILQAQIQQPARPLSATLVECRPDLHPGRGEPRDLLERRTINTMATR